MSDRPSMQRIAELQTFIVGFGSVLRVPQFADTGRAETDIEHSYGLALTCWFLASKIAPELDLGKILQYALSHDLVEIHAGDTFVFADQALLDSKSDREDAAITQLVKDWPDFPEIAKFAKRYKDHADEEAKFVYSVDKILPVLMVNLGEKNAFWERHKVTLERQAAEKVKKMRVSDIVGPYYEELVTWMTDPDYFYKPPAVSK